MIKVVTIVGARPQFIKSAAISRVIKEKFSSKVEEIIVHTGQHYDENMSGVFFNEMEIATPKYNLNVVSTLHGEMTGKMLVEIEKVLIIEAPHVVIVYGDTNSSLAGAIAASKLNIPIAHVESGLRSYKKSMPEEVNRRIIDHISTFLFCPTDKAVENLSLEGYDGIFKIKPTADTPLVLNVGDVMFDNVQYYHEKTGSNKELPFGLESNKYILCTVHRDFNVDDSSKLKNIFDAICNLADVYKYQIIIPLHPRTKNKLDELPELKNSIESNKNIILSEPLGYFDNLKLIASSRLVMTDSGGLQKEAYFFHKPCVVLRNETEWQEIVDAGYAVCTDITKDDIVSSVMKLLGFKLPEYQDLYGEGDAAENIMNSLVTFVS